MSKSALMCRIMLMLTLSWFINRMLCNHKQWVMHVTLSSVLVVLKLIACQHSCIMQNTTVHNNQQQSSLSSSKICREVSFFISLLNIYSNMVELPGFAAYPRSYYKI